MRRRSLLRCLSFTTAGLLLPACNRGSSGPTDPGGPLKVGLIYLGPIGDYGWTFTHEVARQEMQMALGDQIQAYGVENVDEGTGDALEVMRVLARDGHRLILSTSFGFMDATIQAASEFPEITFMHCSGYKRAENVGTYLARFEQPRYLTGMVAGRMTQTGQLGYVAAFPIPEVIRGINAFTLGARSVNPEVTVQVTWAESWYNPQIEEEIAQALIEGGCDVVTQHTDSVAPTQVAQSRGVYSVGYHSDMSAFGPAAHLTASVHRWGQVYTDLARSVLDGSWTSQDIWRGFEGDMVEIAPFHPDVPEDLKAQVMQKRQTFVDQTASPFDGPLRDQEGVERIGAEASLSDGDQLSMDWFVEGVEGQIS